MKKFTTIFAVMKKEFIMIVRYPTWIIQMVIWPLMFPLIYIFSAIGYAGPDKEGFKAFSAVTGTQNFMAFIVVGTMTWMWINITMWDFGTYLRQEQMKGTLESNWLCPINKFDFLIGAAMVSIIQSLIISIISIAEYKFIYGIEFTGNLGEWMFIFLIMLPGVYGFGIMFASLVLWAKETGAAVNVARGAMMILCGITFPINIMPIWMQNISKCLPFTYGISAARQVMVMGTGLNGAFRSIIMCLLEGIIFVLLGRISFIYTEKRVKNEGALGRF